MWDLPRSGIEPVSHTLAGEFFTTEPLGKLLKFMSVVALQCCVIFCCGSDSFSCSMLGSVDWDLTYIISLGLPNSLRGKSPFSRGNAKT